ncbi:hypothetical protein ACFZBU_03200 [Embleya sp. NPDC008237]|uniref:hypothetical protein n=1 Tax=Embleya sp. NPDC008237 TaxID=3363978 RepID=UPI0036E01D12
MSGIEESTTSQGRALTVAGVLALCVALLSGWLSVVAAGSAAAAEPRPTVTVSQSTNLVNQRILVKWTGFTLAADTNAVVVMQCKGTAPKARDCWAPRWTQNGEEVGQPDGSSPGAATKQTGLPTAADGSGQVWLQVRPALRLTELGCTDRQLCSVVAFVMPADGSTVSAFRPKANILLGEGFGPLDTDMDLAFAAGQAAVTPLSFVPAPNVCPGMEHPDLSVNGAGEFTQAGASWVFGLCTARTNTVNMTVSAGSGPSGREVFLSDGVDIGVTQQPIGGALDQARPVALAGVRDKAKTVYAPLTNGALAFSFNIDDTRTRLPITSMNLTPRLIAKLITGAYQAAPHGPNAIVYLANDPEFKAINEARNWPLDLRTPILRGVQDDTIWALTSWLASDPETVTWLSGTPDANGVVCPPDWRIGKANYPLAVYTNRLEMLTNTNVPQTVYEDIVNRLGNSIPTNRTMTETGPKDIGQDKYGYHNVMAITSVEAAARMGTPVAKLRNAAGNFVDPTDPATVRAGVAAAKPGPDGVTLTNDYRSTVANAYPLTITNVAMVSTDKLTAAKAGKIDAFLAYAATAGQVQTGSFQPGALPPGYVPLGDAQKQQITDARKKIADAPKWTGETPPPTTAPVDQGGNNAAGSAGTSTGNNGGPNTPSPADPTGAPTTAPSASPSTAPVGAAAPPADKGPFPPVANLIKDALDGDPSAVVLLVLMCVSGAALIACPVLLSLGHKRRTGGWPPPVAAVLRLIGRQGAAA